MWNHLDLFVLKGTLNRKIMQQVDIIERRKYIKRHFKITISKAIQLIIMEQLLCVMCQEQGGEHNRWGSHFIGNIAISQWHRDTCIRMIILTVVEDSTDTFIDQEMIK